MRNAVWARLLSKWVWWAYRTHSLWCGQESLGIKHSHRWKVGRRKTVEWGDLDDG